MLCFMLPRLIQVFDDLPRNENTMRSEKSTSCVPVAWAPPPGTGTPHQT